MKIKQADILANVLQTMLDTKGIVGYKIARNLRMISEELKEYNDIKLELFKKYGEEKEGRYIIDKDSDNYPLFMKEIEPYEEQEVEFTFRKISENELAESGLDANQMLFLMEYFEGDE